MADEKILGIPTIELFSQGHRACAGCGSALAVRYALKAAGRDTIVVSATGCMEVISSPYPETAWRLPWIHSLFENSSAVASGIERALRKHGKNTNVMVIAGDGGTFDIGLQALSGMAERGQKICFVCYDNEAYMNTGIQRSGATPKYAATTTTPAGSIIHGKTENAKNMPMIMASHGCYVATANIAFPLDMINKIQKALTKNGPSYIQVLAPCQPGWDHQSDMGVEICRIAFETKVSALYEIEEGVLKISSRPSTVKPVIEYLSRQGRFKAISEKEIADIQAYVDNEWERITKLDESKIKIV